MDRAWKVFAFFLVFPPAAAAFEPPLAAQTRTVTTDTVRRPDSLAERNARDRVRQAQERVRQLLREASAYHDAGDRRMEGVRLRQAGNEYFDLNTLDSALVLYRRARELAHTVGNHWDELAAEFNIRNAQSNRAFSDSTLTFWHEALATMRRAGDRPTEAEVLLRISSDYQNQSLDSALTYAKQAAQIARELGNRWESGPGTFSAVGLMYVRLARLDSAEVYLREALKRARANGNQDEEGWALNELATVNSMRGHLDSGLVLFHVALERFHALGDRDAEVTVLTNIGGTQVKIGRPDSGRFYFRQGLEHVRKQGNRFAEQFYLNGIGEAWLAQSRADSALAYFREALRIAPHPGDHRTDAYTLWGLGQAQHALGQTDSALANLRRSLAMHRELGTRDGEAGVLGTIATVHRDAGRRDSALTNYGEGLTLARAAEAHEIELTMLSDLGDFHYKQGPQDLATAVAYYDSAAALRATVGAHAGADPSKVSYAEQGTELYERWALAWLGREQEVGHEASQVAALAAAERGRAQALLDLLRRGQGDDSSNAAGDVRSIGAAGADLVQEGRDLITSVRAMGAPVLAYMATKDTLLTWLILPSGEVTVVRQAVPKDSVAHLVAGIRAQLGADEVLGRALRAIEPRDATPAAPVEAHIARADGRPRSALAHLADAAAVLVPSTLSDRLPVNSDLLIVPQGSLALVSFAALPARRDGVGTAAGETLGARYAIRYAPSLATLRVVTARAAASRPGPGDGRGTIHRGALVVGNPVMPAVRSPRGTVRLPALPAAGRESRWVAQALGVAPLTGRAATERAVRARMAGAPVIHLATHGFAYSSDAKALDSFVAFAADSSGDRAGDGLLTVGEVIDEAPRLTAELVVLSACQTGLGNLKQAEGTVGLQRAFLAKGARSVLVSLWSVSDDATELLMRRFYTHWLRDTDRPAKAEALRRAQADVRQTRGFGDPRYWAAFQLVGAR